MINQEVRHIVEAELRSGEKLLWADKPYKFPLSFMAIYITGFSIFWTTIAVSFVGVGAFPSKFGIPDSETVAEAADLAIFQKVFASAASLFVAIGICMILLGIKMLIGPSKEIYGITNQRGIIISPFIKYRVASLSPEVLKNSERTGGPELGTLMFTSKSRGVMGMNQYQSELIAFRKIRNAKQVENLIQKTFKDPS